MYMSDNQDFVNQMKATSDFLVENQGNQCFATSAFYMLFCQPSFRHAIIGKNLDNFRTGH